ncbi:MAG: HEAT repeat domain-containing protein [Candidatus Thalassarchaeaceae archaeon]
MRHPATLRLNHKDERQRRRAVRKLFEVNDSNNLDSFVPLLEDDDQWYRERAMEAVTKWAGFNDITIVNKLSSSEYVEQRVLASKISLRLGQEKLKIIDRLCSDREITVRIAGWESKLQANSEKIDELILEGLKSKDKIIRKITINKLTKMNDVDVKIVISALQDDSYTVRKAALEIIRNDSKLSEMEIFDSYLLKMSDGNAKKEINSVIKILVKKSLENQEIQEKLISWSESESVEIIDSLISTLREIKWWEIKELKEHMYEKSSDLFVTRLLRGNRESVAAEIRIKILSDSKRSEEMRARLIEDLVGRQVDKMTLKIIKEISISESVLLATISKEFLQEYE